MINLGSEVNAMVSTHTKKLGLQIQKTNIRVQKIDESSLETYSIVLAGFQVQDKFGKARFFQKTFLIADTSMEVIFGIPFLTFNKVEVDFAEKKLT